MGLSKLQELCMNASGIFFENGFSIGKMESTLFTRRMGKDLFICQIYVDDIIFGSTNKSFCDEFSKIMTDRFEMSMMGKLNFYLSFQIKQLEDGAFISQTKYTQDLLKKFGMDKAKPIKTPMCQTVILILIWVVSQLIKRYITLRLVPCLTFVHLGPISCLVCVCVQDFSPHPKGAI
jgi:hypothetical protein